MRLRSLWLLSAAFRVQPSINKKKWEKNGATNTWAEKNCHLFINGIRQKSIGDEMMMIIASSQDEDGNSIKKCLFREYRISFNSKIKWNFIPFQSLRRWFFTPFAKFTDFEINLEKSFNCCKVFILSHVSSYIYRESQSDGNCNWWNYFGPAETRSVTHPTSTIGHSIIINHITIPQQLEAASAEYESTPPHMASN